MKSRGKLLAFRSPSSSSETSSSTGDLSDEALLAACATGERAALGVLYDRHQIPVSRFVSRICCGPRSDVEDLVQCTFIEVWKSAKRFHQRSSVRSWVFGISANLARHYIRSEVRRRMAMHALAEVPAHHSERQDNKMMQAQQLACLAEAIKNLSYEQRVAFVLCDMEGMSGVEAAKTLGVRKGTLWRRLHDARKSLRTKLEAGEKKWT